MSDKFHIPHDLTAERAFVGGLVADDGLALDDLPEISLDLVWSHGERLVMRAILEQRAVNAPCGLIGLTQYMRSTYAKDAPVDGGWGPFLTALMRDGGVPATMDHYLGILRDQLALRGLVALQTWLDGQFTPAADPQAIIRGIGERLAAAEPLADSGDHALPGVVTTILREIDDWNAGNVPKVLKMPLDVWNNAFGGLLGGAYLALGGRPGAGKSSMMEQFLYHLVCEETPVLVFEKDMSPKMLVYRLACRACNVPYWKVSNGYASRVERDAIRQTVAYFPQTKLRLHNPVGLTAEMVASIVRREKRLHGIQAVFLDHIQLLDTGDAETVEGLTRASMKIKASAHDTDIPHVALFQVNRNAPQGIRPKPEHVKGFDQLLSDVDGMAMLWTDVDKTTLQKDELLTMKFYAAKNRAGGETEEEIDFDGPNLTFKNK